MDYVLKPATAGEAAIAFELIRRRVEWLARRGVEQWGEGYLRAYPLEYYEEMQREGRLYLLRDAQGCAAGTAVILETDARWSECAGDAALYIHNLAANPDHPGAGRALIEAAERLARAQKKDYLRLDCGEDNPRLNAYYELLGFVYRGKCADGPYRGNRMEKRLAA